MQRVPFEQCGNVKSKMQAHYNNRVANDPTRQPGLVRTSGTPTMNNTRKHTI